ncbi:hypothetical protein D3C75_1188650 [compost metagenome]
MKMDATEGGITNELVRQIANPRNSRCKSPAFAIGMMNDKQYRSGNDILNPQHNWNGEQEKKYTGPR